MAPNHDDDRSITAADLHRYFGELRAVDGVDLEIPGGQVFGFLGPNGAGKSTLVKMLTTILAPTSGSARVGGHDVVREGGKVRQTIGVALQDVGLDPIMTGRELLVLQARLFGDGRSEAQRRADRLLRMVGLDDVDPKKRARAYSGGMRRRLDLALALVHDPRILFLDEPTTGLDPASRAAIWQEVRRLNREHGMTIFLTTQYLEEADQLADRIAIINHGRIAAEGTPEELKRQVGDEVVELAFADEARAARADEALAGVAPSRQAKGHELRLYFSRAAENVPELIRALDAAGLQPTGLLVKQPSLDDVFLRITGEQLEYDERHDPLTRDGEDEAADPPDAAPAASGASSRKVEG